MKKSILFIFAAILTFTGFDTYASHVAGGEITYEFIGSPVNPYRYRVTLSLIRDSRGVGAPNSANIGYTSSCFGGGSQNAPLMPGSGIGLGTYAQQNPQLPDPFGCVVSTGVGGLDPNIYEIYQYQTTINLPGKCNDWTFFYSLCCRNPAIKNLVNPSANSFYIDALLNNNNGPNNSPVFIDLPARAFCTNASAGGLQVPLSWRQASSEADGDSVVYSFGHPLDDATTQIPFSAGYSRTQPIKTVNGITFINAKKGILSLMPNAATQEDNVVKLNIEEYRFDATTQLWIFKGRISREVTVPIVDLCNASAGKGLTIDVTQPGFNAGSLPADSLFNTYGISVLNESGNKPITNANGDTIAYEIPFVDYNCFDSVIHLVFDFDFECNSLSADASEFRLIGPDSVPRPIISTFAPNCGVNGAFGDDASSEIYLNLHKKLDTDGLYLLQIRKGFDEDVLTNTCGYELESFYTIIINVKNCPTIEYQMENVTVVEDTVIKINWSVDQPLGPYLRPELFNSWDVRRVNNGNEYLIASIPDLNVREYYDFNLKPEQLDYESFTYTVQLVQNQDYKIPANYISSILLQGATRQVSDRQRELKLLWSPYNGWLHPSYQLFLAEVNPDSTLLGWNPYKQKDSVNYFENTYTIDESDRAKEGIYVFKVEGTDELNPGNPYKSTSNWVYISNRYVEIPDTTLVTVRAPNTFTPNEDGYNDRFFIAGFNGNKDYRNVSISVYNRWGQIVFKDENFARRNNAVEGWDGTDMNTGQKLTDGVYYYVLEMYDPGTDTRQDLQGSVTIMGGTN